jgi:hypothetical protein
MFLGFRGVQCADIVFFRKGLGLRVLGVRAGSEDLSAAQIMYPCRQFADICFLKGGGYRGSRI